jgi:hypothetical protein
LSIGLESPAYTWLTKVHAFALSRRAARHPEQDDLVEFGESGKNFIETGKRPKREEAMLILEASLN